MIKKVAKILITLLFLTLFSCEDSITYKSDFEEEPILYCIIDGEKKDQYAIVKKSFDSIEGFEENYVSNVKISLTTQYQTIDMLEKESENNTFPVNYYHTDEFQLASGNSLSIRAVLPDNSELTSTITLPQFSLFFFEVPELVIPLEKLSTDYKLRWNIKNTSENVAFLAVLSIDYTKLEGNAEITNRIELPLEYIAEGNDLVPIYSTVTNKTYQVLSQNAIDIALQNISAGDEVKNNYTILGGEVELYILEENLAKYFASTETFKNSFSVKVYETIISNIIGGKGVFGAYVKRTLPIRLSNSYLKSFGYTVK